MQRLVRHLPGDSFLKIACSHRNFLLYCFSMSKQSPEIHHFTLPHRIKINFVLISFLAFMGYALYANTVNSPFALDDYHNILANKAIRITELSGASLNESVSKSLIKSRPVANISLALNYYFHQYDVSGYHLVNIVIHVLNGILLFFFVQYTLLLASGSVYRKDISFIAFASALLWLVHPLQTQSVTYIIQRMNSLATLFYLASFVSYIRARLSAKKSITLTLACVSVAAGLLALGSKENAVMLPVFILLYDWYFFQNLQFSPSKYHYLLLVLLVLFLLGAVFFYLGPDPLKIAAAGYAGRDFTLQERLLTQLRVVVFYASLVFLPLPSRLTLEHDFALSHSLLNPMTTMFSLFALMGILITAVLCARRERLFSFCLLWFLGNLLIESSIIPLEIIFEHRTYLPSMMLIVIIIVGVHRLFAGNMLKAVIFVTAVILLSSWTYARNSIWENEVSLWTDIADKAPHKPRAQMNLGIILSKEGRMDEAMVYLNRAVQLAPEYALAHYSLGDALMQQRKHIPAAESYAKALEINPADTLARFNLGKSLAAAGRHQNALFHYQMVAGKSPLIGQRIYYFMGNSLYQLGRYSEAVNAYSRALQIKPDYIEAKQALMNTRKIMQVMQAKQPVKAP